MATDRLTNRANGVALPRWDGWQLYSPTATEAGLDRPGSPLPTLLPTSLEPQLRLTVDGNILTIVAPEEIIVARPDRHFLARWWVNGKPYEPLRTEPDPLSEKNGMELSGKELRVRLDFDADRFGANAGDRIGLQLLYLDRGWEFVERSANLVSLLEPGHRTWATNRVEFLVD